MYTTVISWEKTMEIKQFRYLKDNLGYLLYGKHEAIAIDGGAVGPIVSFLGQNSLKLKVITNTHGHPDHTQGNTELVKTTGARLVGFDELVGSGALQLEDHTIRIRHTPGHSADSVVFYDSDIIVSGDTLFIGKVGRCFTGDLEGFLDSIKFILSLPTATKVYPGHDYVEEYLNDIRKLEPGNESINRFLAAYDPGAVVSTIADELAINPALRFNDEKIIQLLKNRGLPHSTEYERWRSVISLVHT